MCDRNLAGEVSRKGVRVWEVRTRQRGKGELSQLGRRAHAIGPARKAGRALCSFRAKFGDGPRTSGAPFSEERAVEFAAAALAGSGRSTA